MDLFAQVQNWVKQNFWRKRDHVDASTGTNDAGLPVVLASDGKLASSIIGAVLTGLGTIATAGWNLTLAGHSTINGILSGGGTVATGGYGLTLAGHSTINGNLTNGGTIATGGYNLSLSGHSGLNGTISGGGTVVTGGFTYTIPATLTAVGVSQRLDQTINAGANATLSPSVPSYSGQCFVLIIFAWDVTLNNPFDQALYILNGIGGIYTCFKVGGGTTITATIVSNQIRISNTHGATNARVVADLITIKA